MGDTGRSDINQEELEKLEKEIAERTLKLEVVEREIAGVEFKLKNSGVNRIYLEGSAAKLQGAESLRKKLKVELSRKKKHLDLLRQDLDKALEKKKFIYSDETE